MAWRSQLMKKRIELASKYFNIKINAVEEIPKCEEMLIINRLSTQDTEKLVSKYPISLKLFQGPKGTDWNFAIISR